MCKDAGDPWLYIEMLHGDLGFLIIFETLDLIMHVSCRPIYLRIFIANLPSD